MKVKENVKRTIYSEQVNHGWFISPNLFGPIQAKYINAIMHPLYVVHVYDMQVYF